MPSPLYPVSNAGEIGGVPGVQELQPIIASVWREACRIVAGLSPLAVPRSALLMCYAARFLISIASLAMLPIIRADIARHSPQTCRDYCIGKMG
jgi:hypothetical protein